MQKENIIKLLQNVYKWETFQISLKIPLSQPRFLKMSRIISVLGWIVSGVDLCLHYFNCPLIHPSNSTLISLMLYVSKIFNEDIYTINHISALV